MGQALQVILSTLFDLVRAVFYERSEVIIYSNVMSAVAT